MCTFAIPIGFMVYFYGNIQMELLNARIPGNANPIRDLKLQKTRLQIVKTSRTIVIVFLFAWLPLQTLMLSLYLFPALRIINYGSNEYYLIVGCFCVFHWFTTVYSCINPILYCSMAEKFKLECRQVFALLASLRILNTTASSQSSAKAQSISQPSAINELPKRDLSAKTALILVAKPCRGVVSFRDQQTETCTQSSNNLSANFDEAHIARSL